MGTAACTVQYCRRCKTNGTSATLRSAGCRQCLRSEDEFPRDTTTVNSQQPTANPPSSRPPATLLTTRCMLQARKPAGKPASHLSAQKDNLVQRSPARPSEIQGPGPRAPVGSNCCPGRKCYPDREKGVQKIQPTHLRR